MLGAILKQVVSGLKYIPQDIEAAFERSKGDLDGRELESREIVGLLITSLLTLQRSYICIDALDEFPRDYRSEFFELLACVIRESPGTRLFVTGRQHIREEVERYFTRRRDLQIKPTEEDIKNYLSSKLSDDPQPDAMDHSLREEIFRTIPEKISDMYVIDPVTFIHKSVADKFPDFS